MQQQSGWTCCAPVQHALIDSYTQEQLAEFNAMEACCRLTEIVRTTELRFCAEQTKHSKTVTPCTMTYF